MDDLLTLKGIIIETLVELQKDPRMEIKLALANMFTKPLVNFGEAYDTFSSSIGQDSSASDRWRVIQLDVITKAGVSWEALLARFKSVYVAVMKESPGGESFFEAHKDIQRISYNIALMFRVYGDTMYVDTVPTPEPSK